MGNCDFDIELDLEENLETIDLEMPEGVKVVDNGLNEEQVKKLIKQETAEIETRVEVLETTTAEIPFTYATKEELKEYVSTNTKQTITGVKTFTSPVWVCDEYPEFGYTVIDGALGVRVHSATNENGSQPPTIYGYGAIEHHREDGSSAYYNLPTEAGTLLTEEKAEEVYAPKGYRLIQDITLEEDIQNIDISKDKDGKSLKLKGVFARFFGQFTGTAGSRTLRLDFNGGQTYQMYTNYTVEIGADYLHFIKSERINNSEYDKGIYVSQFPKTICKPTAGATMQGLSDMIRDMQCDYSESTLTPQIKRIRYGQKDSTAGLMATGSRILIWGIDDDE